MIAIWDSFRNIVQADSNVFDSEFEYNIKKSYFK